MEVHLTILKDHKVVVTENHHTDFEPQPREQVVRLLENYPPDTVIDIVDISDDEAIGDLFRLSRGQAINILGGN